MTGGNVSDCAVPAVCGDPGRRVGGSLAVCSGGSGCVDDDCDSEHGVSGSIRFGELPLGICRVAVKIGPIVVCAKNNLLERNCSILFNGVQSCCMVFQRIIESKNKALCSCYCWVMLR